MARNDLTQEQVKKVLDYNPETGIFTWKFRPTVSLHINSRFLGKEAGSVDSKGYIVIEINSCAYKAHRLAWLYINGNWPKDQIDHADLNKKNNSILNLREADRSQNSQNFSITRRNTSGYKGINILPSGNYKAEIICNGEWFYLGVYPDKESAHAAYCKAAKELHGEFARTA